LCTQWFYICVPEYRFYCPVPTYNMCESWPNQFRPGVLVYYLQLCIDFLFSTKFFYVVSLTVVLYCNFPFLLSSLFLSNNCDPSGTEYCRQSKICLLLKLERIYYEYCKWSFTRSNLDDIHHEKGLIKVVEFSPQSHNAFLEHIF
jgi:hypothetical protein